MDFRASKLNNNNSPKSDDDEFNPYLLTHKASMFCPYKEEKEEKKEVEKPKKPSKIVAKLKKVFGF